MESKTWWSIERIWFLYKYKYSKWCKPLKTPDRNLRKWLLFSNKVLSWFRFLKEPGGMCLIWLNLRSLKMKMMELQKRCKKFKIQVHCDDFRSTDIHLIKVRQFVQSHQNASNTNALWTKTLFSTLMAMFDHKYQHEGGQKRHVLQTFLTTRPTARNWSGFFSNQEGLKNSSVKYQHETFFLSLHGNHEAWMITFFYAD